MYSRGNRKVPVLFPSLRASVSVEWKGNVHATFAGVPFDDPFRLNGYRFHDLLSLFIACIEALTVLLL